MYSINQVSVALLKTTPRTCTLSCHFLQTVSVFVRFSVAGKKQETAKNRVFQASVWIVQIWNFHANNKRNKAHKYFSILDLQKKTSFLKCTLATYALLLVSFTKAIIQLMCTNENAVCHSSAKFFWKRRTFSPPYIATAYLAYRLILQDFKIIYITIRHLQKFSPSRKRLFKFRPIYPPKTHILKQRPKHYNEHFLSQKKIYYVSYIFENVSFAQTKSFRGNLVKSYAR